MQPVIDLQKSHVRCGYVYNSVTRNKRVKTTKHRRMNETASEERMAVNDHLRARDDDASLHNNKRRARRVIMSLDDAVRKARP